MKQKYDQTNTGTINDAITSILLLCANTTGAAITYHIIFGTLVCATQLKNKMRPSYEVNYNDMIWYGYAVIKLSTFLFES